MAGVQLLKSTNERLYDWGDWARTGRIKLGTKGTLGQLSGSTVASLAVPDDEAEVVDRVLARLISRDKQMGMAVKLYYLNRLNYRVIGKKMEINKDKAQRLVFSGVAWIDAALVFQPKRVTTA